MVEEGGVPALCTIATQTSRPTTALVPALRPISEEPSITLQPLAQQQISSQHGCAHRLLPELSLHRSLTSLTNQHAALSSEEEEFLYSDKFAHFYASARAIKRDQKRNKYLSGSLPDVSGIMKKPLTDAKPVPVADIKEGTPFTRNNRRYHSIADFNNMRNRFTASRQTTFERLKSGDDSSVGTPKRRTSPFATTASQGAPSCIPPLVGRGVDIDLGGLLRSDSFKTLNSGRSRSLQRPKTQHSQDGRKSARATFIPTGDDAQEKHSIYKLSADAMVHTTPHESLEVLANVPLLSPGDSDRMCTPDLNKYVNGNASHEPFSDRSERFQNGGDATQNGNVLPGETNTGNTAQPHTHAKTPVIRTYGPGGARRTTPKMVLKYYGTELASKSGVMPSMLGSENHVRGIMLNGHARLQDQNAGSRKVHFNERRPRRPKEKERRLAATETITLSAENTICTVEGEEKPVALTTKNLAMFEDYQHRQVKTGSRSRQKDTEEVSEGDSKGRVLQWVKENQDANRKGPQIIPIKHTKESVVEGTGEKLT